MDSSFVCAFCRGSNTVLELKRYGTLICMGAEYLSNVAIAAEVNLLPSVKIDGSIDRLTRSIDEIGVYRDQWIDGSRWTDRGIAQ